MKDLKSSFFSVARRMILSAKTQKHEAVSRKIDNPPLPTDIVFSVVNAVFNDRPLVYSEYRFPVALGRHGGPRNRLADGEYDQCTVGN